MAAKGQCVQRLGFVGLVLAVACALLTLALIAPPASAQYYGGYGRPKSGGMFNSFFGPFSGPRYGYGPPERPADYSHAPAPRKLETQPAGGSVLVLGDAMADWLAYGLEDALGDTPDYAVVRKNRTTSGLVHYDSRNETQDWAAVAREAITATKPKFIVMMIGLNDRQSIREKMTSSGSAAAPSGATPQAKPAPEPKPAPDTESTPADAADAERSPAEQPPPPAPTVQSSKTTTTTTRYRLYEFRSDEWAELYTKRIDATIAALKSGGVPVLWVGLPSIRGPKSTADMVYLNDLYRARAEKAGITYIDVWDGFVDEAGHFTLHGPDFEGQTRRLRVSDGVYFTKAGARKLAHYVEREIQRVSLPGSEPVALPASEPQAPAAAAKPGGPVARPLSGPAVPLTASIAGADKLVGSGGASEPAGPAPVTRVLVKGDAVPPPAGRSDDFQWPRRSIAPFGTDPIVATTTEPLPVMKSPQETTVAAPNTEMRPVAAAPAPKRTTTNTANSNTGRAPYQAQQRGFSFFSFFR
jgi:hypothetical protein